MANIRNQCTWVHSKERENATKKSKDLVRMAVARASLLEPIPDFSVEINKSALVIGGGVAGMTSALGLADQGFHTTIVEKSSELGGAARGFLKTWRGQDVQEYLSEMIKKVEEHPSLEVLLNAEVVGAYGFVGNFETNIALENTTKSVKHGATIIATGGQAADTDEYLYGKNSRVTRWHDLEHDPEKLKDAKKIVFIQCVGSRDEKRPYCSRICCTTSVSQAIFIKEMNPDADVFVLYRDMRTYGEREALYKQAREKGVIFIRYSLDKKPTVKEINDGLEVSVFDPVLEKDLLIKADFVNLTTAIEPTGTDKIAGFYKLSINEEKFIMEAHAKLRPVDCSKEGVFICGLAHYPKTLEESVAQAQAAASRAVRVLAQRYVKVEPIVSVIDQDLCVGCGLCEISCAFGAIQTKKVPGKGFQAENISALCKGCGVCAVACPQQAIDMKHFSDQQMIASIYAGGMEN
jgi:heterodisulfide reductase subunit A